MLAGYLNLLLIMFRGLSSGKFIQLYEVRTLCLHRTTNPVSVKPTALYDRFSERLKRDLAGTVEVER